MRVVDFKGRGFESVAFGNFAPRPSGFWIRSGERSRSGNGEEPQKEDATSATQKTKLTTELNQANEILQQIPTESQGVNELYSAISGYNQNSNGAVKER